jgi:hypothetical protein
MKKILYTLSLVVLFAFSAGSQIKLIGLSNNTESGALELVQWNAFDSASVTSTPIPLDAYLFATSSFDSFNGKYYIAGISGQTTGLFSHTMETGESSLTSGSVNTNIAEFDMSTSKMYNLIMETEEYTNVYEYDMETNQESLIGTIYQPGAIGLVVDAISFDSNNGILYYVGYTSVSGLALYSIPVREEAFSYTETVLVTPTAFSNITSLNFDNVSEKLFATNDTYDANGEAAGRSIVEIDITTGTVTTLWQLTDFPYFLGGSSLYDQNTGTYMLVGITEDNMAEMIAFNTYTNTYETGFVPSVSEIVCNNTLFAQNRYMAASVATQEAFNFRLYPNPVADVLILENASRVPVRLQMFSAIGELVYEANTTFDGRMSVDMSAFASGLYTVTITHAQQTVTRKIVVE